MERRRTVEQALAQAIETNECLPHFQPQFNLMTGRIFGLEALARWYHSELGWISPSEFIPIAECNGDIVSLGWKILETSCSEIQQLPADLSVSVNLSVAQILSDDVVAMLEECLSRTGLPATRLKLEVTETTLMNDLRRIRSTLSELRALGIGISLDDFGVGYSALSYLTDFHWDEIKIDRSFAIKTVKDKKQREILKMVLGIAETMGSQVLIEGIETVEQRDVLVDIGCTVGQGYLFGGPMAIDDIMTLFFPEHGKQRLVGL
jgi:EAL domain-containing protein (putative c-di-GMP-specific phosphodiesterase class I)